MHVLQLYVTCCYESDNVILAHPDMSGAQPTAAVSVCELSVLDVTADIANALRDTEKHFGMLSRAMKVKLCVIPLTCWAERSRTGRKLLVRDLLVRVFVNKGLK